MSSQTSLNNLTELTFSILTNRERYEQAFCIDPPDDFCPFGVPCPNPDVTGIGQQISIYITTVIYAVVIAYIPWLQRPLLYAHLSVLYSLLIAGLISMLKGELSRGDGIFVIVTVASPASLYLWYYSIKSIWKADDFPIEQGNKSKPANQSMEVKIVRLVSLGSLVFEIAMICVLFIPKVKKINFPQTACDMAYGTRALWYNVAWELPVAIQLVCMTVLYFITYGIFWLWTRRQAYEIPAPLLEPFKDNDFDSKNGTTRRENIDLISWTERVLFDQYPNFMNRSLFICIITIAQISALPNLNYVIQSKDCFGILLIAFGLFRELPRKEANRIKTFAIRIVVFLFFAVVWIARMVFGVFLVPNSADWIILFIACSAASWSWSRFAASNMKIFLPVVTVFLALVLTEANIWIIVIGDPKGLDFGSYSVTAKNARRSFFVIEMLTLLTWIVCWLATSVWPWRRTVTLDKFNKGLWKRGHLLKMFWIILGPHILWIQASNNSNQSHPVDMTFGQIFALIVSVVTIITLLDEAKDVKKDIWIAVLKSDVMYYEEVEQPKHYAPQPGLGLS
ncbi:hypothetical protein DFP72DRAFT_1018165 [Ephemerocybe angulata]|uniref:Uncharacterized protein n=2 Tax=Ephemerocybe angulata TaxID=980116 RepID=A0A8H6HE57_9AGAR|nr:hypothetical protein DFP72DRAFT_1018165 [Tulosesus angulatus]